MSKLTIKKLSFYGFIVLILAIVLSSASILYFLFNINSANNDLIYTKEASKSFLKQKIATDTLLTSNDIEIATDNWEKLLTEFNSAFKKLKNVRYNNIGEIDNLWYSAKDDVRQIRTILNNNIISSKNLKKMPLLKAEGILFKTEKNTKLYSTIVLLNQKIQNLIQYEQFIIKEFRKLETRNETLINNKITNSIVSAVLYPIIILIISTFLIYYINKKIKLIERELENSKQRVIQSYEKVKEAHILTQSIMNSIPVAVFWKDINSKYLGANDNFLKDVGVKNLDDILGKNDFELPWGDTEAQSYIDDDQEVIKSGKSKVNYEETHTFDNGDVIFLITSKVPFKNTKGEVMGVIGSYLDVTEKMKLENDLKTNELILLENSKMAAMGEMVESIAHQWRQPLSVITTSASSIYMLKDMGMLSDEKLKEMVASIEKSAMHLSATIDDFREFYKNDKNAHYFYIKSTIEKAKNLIISKLKNRSIDVNIDFEDVQVYGYDNEVVQVFMNLFNNSIDALEDNLDENRTIQITLKEYEKNIEIYFQDNAGGIPDDIIIKVFDHKFTTKAAKDGTGIGLYMSKKIVTKSNGLIEVENREFDYKDSHYKGACFIVTLPKIKNESDE